jgi:diaminopimelate epimerase
MAVTTLAKYHGLGNDFLVLVDPEGTGPYDPATVAAVCDRHRGFGADGVLRLSRPRAGGDLRMELRNANGGEAETSGNGLRCAVLAAAHEGLVSSAALDGGPVRVETAAGTATARLLGAGDGVVKGALGSVAVEMGMATLRPTGPAPLPGATAWRVDVGNPHLVLLVDDLASVDLGVVGPALEQSVAGGTNVEAARTSADRDRVEMVVWERGVGRTEACGSGSCAVAAVARSEGLVGDRVVVRNPGGDLVVELAGSPERPSVTLTGPACRIGSVLVDLDQLVGLAGTRVGVGVEAPA